MTIEDTLSTRVAQIHSEAVRLALAAMPSVATYIALVTIGGVFVDQSEDFAVANLGLSIASLVLGYWVVISMLRDGGLAQDGLAAGFGAYFGLSFLSGVGTLLGLLVLVVPGLLLLIRWAPLFGYGLIDGDGVGEAFSKSWRSTDGHFAPIAMAMVTPLILYAGALGVYFFATDELGRVAMVPAVAANLAMALAGATMIAIGIAVYSLVRDVTGELTEVFE